MTMALDEQPPTVKPLPSPIKITGMDRKGAGRMWSFARPTPKIKTLLEKLNYEVTVTHDGRRVGGVWKMNGHWVWAIEAWAIGEPESFKGQQVTSYPSK